MNEELKCGLASVFKTVIIAMTAIVSCTVIIVMTVIVSIIVITWKNKQSEVETWQIKEMIHDARQKYSDEKDLKLYSIVKQIYADKQVTVEEYHDWESKYLDHLFQELVKDEFDETHKK